MSRPTKAQFEEMAKRLDQVNEMASQALQERNKAQSLMMKYQTLSLALAEALRREQGI